MKKTVLPIVIVLCLFFGFIFLCPGLRYYYWGDETRQVIPLTLSLWHDIREGTFGFWNPEFGFGGSNAIQLFSYLGSPTFWLFLLFPNAEMILDFLPITTILSLSLASVWAYLWIKDLVQDETARFAGTVIMTFCGWAVFQFHYYSYVDAWMYICLLLYAMEEHLQGRKKLLFPLIVALITILDLFTMYMASWLILFYMSVRLCMMHGSLPFKEWFCSLRKPFLYYLLGLGMAGTVFVCASYVLLTSNRVGGSSENLNLVNYLFVTPGGLFRLITSLFSPVINDYDYNLYSSPFPEGAFRTYALFSYSFILCPLLLPQLAVRRERQFQPVKRILLLLAVISLIPAFYYLFNGNQASRWCFYFIVFHVMAICLLLEHREQLDQKLLLYSGIGCLVLLVLFTVIGIVLHTAGNRRALLMIVPFLMAGAAAYTYALRKGSMRLFRAVLLCEAVLCITSRVVNGTTITIGAGERAEIYETALLDTEVTDRIQAEEDGFYRIATDESTAENYLLPMAKHYNGNSVYFSIFNPASEAYYRKRIAENWFIPYLPSKFLSYGVFGNRYICSYEADTFIPYGYDYLYTAADRSGNAVGVYRYDSSLSFGYASADLINADYADTVDRSLQDYLLAEGILCREGTAEPGADSRFIDLGTINNGVIDYPFDTPGTLYLDYSSAEPYGAGSYELYRNGNVVLYQEFEEYGYHAVRIEEPADAVGVYAYNSNFTSAGIDVHLYWISDASLQEVYESREQQYDPLVFESEEKGNYMASIRVTGAGKWVATSIPYDPGWRVFVNGQKIKPEIVNTSFIGFPLPEGSYEIRFIYTPPGLIPGCVISVISIIIFAVLAVRAFRRKHAV